MSKSDRDGRGPQIRKECQSPSCPRCVNGQAKRPHRRRARARAKRQLRQEAVED